MDERKSQIIGLIGFIFSGFFFIAAGIKYEDPLTIGGSIVWLISCIIWLIPFIRPANK